MNFSISIVSHGSGSLVSLLLRDLSRYLPPCSEILLTLNKPEDESFLAEYTELPIRILRNVREMGFGANHNQAFAVSAGHVFVIANPDIRLRASPFEALTQALADDPTVGACAPVVLAPSGQVDDSARRFPTVARLILRVALRRRRLDYDVRAQGRPITVDWAAGMFVAFPRGAFIAVGGFDTRYFMYLEDTDICRRLGALGQRVVLVPRVYVVHDAQRASRHSWPHLRWHLRSVARFLFHL